MAQDWFRLSLKNGALVPIAKPPPASKPAHWIERDLENILTLNPDFLGVADLLPLRLQGIRGTVTSPDQAFVEELGRVVVVEVKKVRAQLAAVAQVMAYASHWQMLPPAEIDRGLAEIATEQNRYTRFGQALVELQTWADAQLQRVKDGAGVKRLGERVIKRLRPEWSQELSTKLSRFAENFRSDGDRSCIGAPARMIVVAPGFSDECIEFAEKLTDRMVGIELVEVEIVRVGGEVYVGRNRVHRSDVSEPTWRLLREAWTLPSIREHFVINGFADQLNTESFSLSCRGVNDARLWIWASETDAFVTTVVPDGWYQSDKRRRRELREELLLALPEGFNPSERWLEWKFKLPRDRAKMIGVLDSVAAAIKTVLRKAHARA
jgi:hypothetical protein